MTGMALIIFAIIQQHTQGLSIFHALVVLNLCWITVFGSLIPLLVLVFSEDEDVVTTKIVKHKSNGMFLLFIVKLMLMGGFGVWMLSQFSTFDSTPNPCTSSTVFWILGHYPHVTSRPFRKALLALYSLLLVPFVNVFASILLLLPALLASSPVAFLVRIIAASYIPSAPPQRVFRLNFKVFYSASLALQNAIMVVTIEKTIQSNNVGSEEQKWGLGQTYAVMVALIPALEVCKQIFRLFKQSPETVQETVQDRTPSPTIKD